jgi:hypothetical protein
MSSLSVVPMVGNKALMISLCSRKRFRGQQNGTLRA